MEFVALLVLKLLNTDSRIGLKLIQLNLVSQREDMRKSVHPTAIFNLFISSHGCYYSDIPIIHNPLFIIVKLQN